MRGFVVALMLVNAQPALACHKFHTWRYPYPQRCGLPEERVTIEITLTPELLETWARQDAIERLKEQAK